VVWWLYLPDFPDDIVARMREFLPPPPFRPGGAPDTGRRAASRQSFYGKHASPPPLADEPRYVNLTLTDVHSVPVETLQVSRHYLARLDIGALRPESIVQHETASPFPDELLPPGTAGWWLTIRAAGDAVADEQFTGAVFLPASGPSFVCPCSPGVIRHRCEPTQRLPFLDISVVTPGQPGRAGLRVDIYLDAVLVHALRAVLPAGTGERPSAEIVWSRDTMITDLVSVDRRSAGVFEETENGRHRVIIGARPELLVSFELGEGQAGTVARTLRTTLFNAHFTVERDELVSRYDAEFRKPAKECVEDLRALAVAGAQAYLSMLMTSDARNRLAAWLRGEAQRMDLPPIIQLARAANTRLAFPWQLVYDEPIAGDGSTLQICDSVREFGPRRRAKPVPASCPYEYQHDGRDGTLCPFGFWGLANLLEVPPFTGGRLAERTATDPPASLLVALNAELDGPVWQQHQTALGRLVGQEIMPSTDVTGLRAAAGAGTDVLYFFVHGTLTAPVGTGPPGYVLDLGRGGRIAPTDVAAWARLNPPLVWQDRRPLVILNGCRTGEVLPDTSAEFVSAFVGETRAAGVLATEITMETGLAATAMQRFLAALWRGRGVGAALREMRWALLAQGNVMGLAYSPYCDAELRLPEPAGQKGGLA
jgi:hypothetical protein